MTYTYAAALIATRAPHAAGTLLKMLRLVEHENLMYVRPPRTSLELGIPFPTFRDHFEQLRAAGAIVPDPKEEDRQRGITQWRICPFLAWRGTKEATVRYLNSLPENHPFHAFAEPIE